MFRGLHNLIFGRSARRARQERKALQRRMTLEQLDERRVMAADIQLLAGGVLTITGDNTKNEAVVESQNGKVDVSCTYISLFKFTKTATFNASQVNKIEFQGKGDDDSFTNRTSIRTFANGANGNDTLVGGLGDDQLYGDSGNDVLKGAPLGDDRLNGGSGDDTYVIPATGATIVGNLYIEEAPNAGADTLDLSGRDQACRIDLARTDKQVISGIPMFGGKTTLQLSNDSAIENVIGSSAADEIFGNTRNNNLKGGDGDDHLEGRAGDDTLQSGKGKNVLIDGEGGDTIDYTQNAVGVEFHSQGGDDSTTKGDTIYGTAFADKLYGSNKNDTIYGFEGNDRLEGGSGDDKLNSGRGVDQIYDGLGNDQIDFASSSQAVNFTTGGGNDAVNGSKYNDRLTGASGNDQLFGNGGNDKLFGKGGNDKLYGGDGNDWLEAGTASETADGGAGTDYNAHRWAIDGVKFSDVRQTHLGTCVFLSALSGGALQGIDLSGRIVYLGNYLYRVKLYNAETSAVKYETVFFDGTPAIVAGLLTDPAPSVEGEFWTTLYQRAYISMALANDVNYHDREYALYAVTGRTVTIGDWSVPTVLYTQLLLGHVVIAGNADQTAEIFDSHSYTVTKVYQQPNGLWYIQLRNPWGRDGGIATYGDPEDGIIEMTWFAFQGYHDFDTIAFSN